MVDNRSAGFFGIGGSFNFKSGDISGTAARTSDEKNGQGGEYFAQGQEFEEDENFRQEPYVDRSAVLRASLDSLATLNAANINKREKIKPKQEIKHRLQLILMIPFYLKPLVQVQILNILNLFANLLLIQLLMLLQHLFLL